MVAPESIGEVHLIPLEIPVEILQNDFGQEGEIAVDMPLAVIYRKSSGVWTQIWPAIIL